MRRFVFSLAATVATVQRLAAQVAKEKRVVYQGRQPIVAGSSGFMFIVVIAHDGRSVAWNRMIVGCSLDGLR
jgi:hypothetical protein